MIARLVPRCTDPDAEVRKLAVDCIYVSLKIASRVEGEFLLRHVTYIMLQTIHTDSLNLSCRVSMKHEAGSFWKKSLQQQQKLKFVRLVILILFDVKVGHTFI